VFCVPVRDLNERAISNIVYITLWNIALSRRRGARRFISAMRKWLRQHTRNCFRCSHCFGRIWKLAVFTIFWLIRRGVSQKRVKTASFQILSKQWKERKQCWASRFFQNSEKSENSELPDSPKQWKEWKQRTSRFFQNSEKSENSELPDSSKTVKRVKTKNFQMLPKQWNQWKQFCGLNHFVIVRWYRRGARLDTSSCKLTLRDWDFEDWDLKRVMPVHINAYMNPKP